MTLTNEQMLEEWEGDSWYPAIQKCDRLLNMVIPGYQITQIKQKFDGLRYYISHPEGVTYDSDAGQIAKAIIAQAEMEVYRLQGFYINIVDPRREEEDAD